MPYMNVRDPYRLPHRLLAVGIVLLAVPCAPRAQLMPRGNALPATSVCRAGTAGGCRGARADARRGAGTGWTEERGGDDRHRRSDAWRPPSGGRRVFPRPR